MSIASEPILPARGLRTARRLAAGVVLATLVASAGAEWARAGENLEEFRVDGNFIVGIVQRRWEALALPVGWRIHRDGVINNTNNGNTAPLSVDQAAAVVEQAFQRWNEIPDAALEAVFDLGCNLTGLRIDIECLDGKTSTALSGLDGENIMTWSDPGAVGPSALAVTIITSLQEDLTLTSANRDLNGDGHPDISPLIYPDGVTLPAGTMVDADIVYNAAGFDWLGEPSPIARVVDLLGIALHEQGHWFGLAHSPLIEPTAVMFPFVDLSSLERIEGLQTLTTDDRSAAPRVYPLEPGASQNFGIVRGTLVDASGQPVEGEPVVAINALTLERVSFGFSAHALSEIRPEDGSFTIEGLPPGTYLLQVEALDGAHGYLNRLRYNASTSRSAFGGHRPSLVVEAAVESDQDDLLAPRRVSVPALAEGGIIDVGAIVVNTEEPDVSPLGAATLLGFKDNEAILVDFPEGFLFPFYGIEYRQMFVYDNGYVTFTNATNPSPDPINIRVVGTRFADESLEEFLTNSPRVAVLFRNHDPSTDDRGPNKGPIDVYLESGPDHVALTWAAVPEVWLNTSLQDRPVRGGTFRLTLFVDGLIEMEYGSLSTP
ncbi:MAG: matrixin family metalloprotease, partial [Acidobacteriota bacterium]